MVAATTSDGEQASDNGADEFSNIGTFIEAIAAGLENTGGTPQIRAAAKMIGLIGKAAGGVGTAAGAKDSIPYEVGKFLASTAGGAATTAAVVSLMTASDAVLLATTALLVANPVVGFATVVGVSFFLNYAGGKGTEVVYDWALDVADSLITNILKQLLSDGEVEKPESGWPPSPPSPPRDPLVLDLDGDGVELVSLSNSVAHFDYENDGFSEKTGWLKSDDAFLIHDDKGNGKVDGISEIFGNADQDGFTALKAFDTNSDGRVDANDANFANLKLWRDLNGNGVFDAGEMFSLEEYNIASIGVEAKASTKVTDGNQIAYEGVFTRTDGSSGRAEAILFNTNPTASIWNMPDGFEVSADAEILPNLKGYGLLPDLSYSMSLDDELRELVESYVLDVLTLPAGQIRSQFETVLLSWAGVTDVSSNDRGNYIDGKIVAFLEKYYGSELVGNSDGTIGSAYASVIKSSYDTVLDVLLTRFLSQSTLSALKLNADLETLFDSPLLSLTLLGYNVDTDQFSNNPNDVVDWIIDLAPEDIGSKVDYYAKAVTGLFGLKYEYFSNDNSAFKTYIVGKVNTSEAEHYGLLAFIDVFLDTGKLTDGTAEADILNGTSSKDVFLAGRGNDVLNGASGNDTYVYSRGDGQDTITDSGWAGYNDKLVFTDINPSDVTLVRNGNDVTIVIAESTSGAGDAGSVLLKNALGSYTGVDTVVFADGTTWNQAAMRVMLLAQASTNGNDTVAGFDGNDTINAGAGHDTITGGNGNDIITGGLGNDVIDGGSDDDTYIYARGDGQDTITDSGWAGYNDKLVFTDINPSDVTLVRNGNDVTIVIAESTSGAGDAGSVLLKNALGSYTGVDTVVFADGTTWNQAAMISNIDYVGGTDGNDTITGTTGSDSIIIAGLGDDRLVGLSGSDRYMYSSGDGNDYIEDASNSASDVDVLTLSDLNVADLTFSRSGSHVKITVGSTGHTITLDNQVYSDSAYYGIEKIEFADGTVWDRAQIKAASISRINGTSGNDTLVGTALNDVFNGGLGDDRFNSGAGSDTYIYASGDGNDYIDDESGSTTDVDVLKLTDLKVGDLTFSRTGSHAKITVNGFVAKFRDGLRPR